jgi:hypothetical protein
MAKVSKASVSQVQDVGIVEDRREDLGGYTVDFLTHRQGMDLAPLLVGLPDDRCQCPHWGFVVSGRMTMRFADHEEVYEAGDAFYAPPGHCPTLEAGTEYIQFSPTADMKVLDEVLQRNVAAMMGG